MIGRLWHGWTTAANADAYEKLLVSEVLPGIHRVPGYRGAWLMRRAASDGIEFVTLTLFDSMEAVRAFAGEDYEKAVIAPEGRRLLSRFDERSVHYEVVLSPQADR
jgi:heme-degrading monooxygenase HmoA